MVLLIKEKPFQYWESRCPVLRNIGLIYLQIWSGKKGRTEGPTKKDRRKILPLKAD